MVRSIVLITSHREGQLSCCLGWCPIGSVNVFFECDTESGFMWLRALPSSLRKRARHIESSESAGTVNSLYRQEAAPTGARQMIWPSANRRVDLYHSYVLNTPHRTSIGSFHRVWPFFFCKHILFVSERWPRPWFFWPRGLEKPNTYWVVSPRNGYWSCHWKEKVGIPISL